MSQININLCIIFLNDIIIGTDMTDQIRIFQLS